MTDWIEQFEYISAIPMPAPVLVVGDDAKMLGLSVVFLGEVCNDNAEDKVVPLHDINGNGDDIKTMLNIIFELGRPFL